MRLAWRHRRHHLLLSTKEIILTIILWPQQEKLALDSQEEGIDLQKLYVT